MLSVEVKTYRLCRSLSTKKYKQTEMKKIKMLNIPATLQDIDLAKFKRGAQVGNFYFV